MTTSGGSGALAVTRVGPRLTADPDRVISQLFVPGHYLPTGSDGQATGVVANVLAIDETDVPALLQGLVARFGGRHRNLLETFRANVERIDNRLDDSGALSDDRLLLLGATFTHEYAVEAAALCNPSLVVAPDQAGVAEGAVRLLMSVRQIGEGHRSSIGFRTGMLAADGTVTIDDPGPYTTAGSIHPADLRGDSFVDVIGGARGGGEAATWVLSGLGEHFTLKELEARLVLLEAQQDTRQNVSETVARFRDRAARTYVAEFPASSTLSERVLYPATAAEANGMEDARFVRLVEDDGSAPVYHATYTAFDGRRIAQQLLTTADFLRFDIAPLSGMAAANKGLALFPRRIGGKYAAMSRLDGASNAIAFSDSLQHWPTATRLECPSESWEAIQVGNCGPPIETDDGWLVITHGVGPMRSYAIGAWLLDLDDPTKLIGRLRRPLLEPLPEEQDGYVPNVVYSCGSLVHGETLLVPFGIGDSAIRFATVPLRQVLDAMA